MPPKKKTLKKKVESESETTTKSETNSADSDTDVSSSEHDKGCAGCGAELVSDQSVLQG